MKLIKFFAAAAWMYAGVVSAQVQPTVSLRTCLISAFEEVSVPGREPGLILSLSEASREGTEVKAGQILGHLDNLDAIAKKKGAEHELKVAISLAESKAEWEAAVKTKAVAEAEVAAAEAANARNPNAVSKNELNRLKLTVERSEAEIQVKALEYKNNGFTRYVKAAQVDAAMNELDRRVITSPLDGVVVERIKQKGEWVQPGETVLKIVRMNRLRVEGYVKAKEYLPGEIAGTEVIISVLLPDRGSTSPNAVQKRSTKGVIEFVSPIVDASGEYRVWAEFDNQKDPASEQWIFRPGTTAEMEIKVQRNGVATARPTALPLRDNAVSP